MPVSCDQREKDASVFPPDSFADWRTRQTLDQLVYIKHIGLRETGSGKK
jgi:hypothetical protein